MSKVSTLSPLDLDIQRPEPVEEDTIVVSGGCQQPSIWADDNGEDPLTINGQFKKVHSLRPDAGPADRDAQKEPHSVHHEFCE